MSEAAISLERSHQFLLHASLLALVSVAATATSAVLDRAALIPLALLTAGQGLVVISAYYAKRDLIQRLAMQPGTESLAQVRRYCVEMLQQPRRNRLAAHINSLIEQAGIPGAFPLRDRIVLVEPQLRMLAHQLATPEVSIQARSMVMCARLLTHGVESPFFNPDIPVEELHATLLRVRLGIGRGG